MDKTALGLVLILAIIALLALLTQTPTIQQQPPRITIMPDGALAIIP